MNSKVLVNAVSKQAVTRYRHQFVLGVRFENAIARVELLASLRLDHEEPIPLNRQVRRACTDLNRPLRKIRRDLGDQYAEANLSGVRAAGVLAGRRAQSARLQKLRGPVGLRRLKAHGTGVRQVVAHHVDRRLGGVHARQGRAEC